MFKQAKCSSASPSVILTIPTTPRSKMLGVPLLSSCGSSVPPPIVHPIFIIKTSEWWSKSFSCAKGEKPRLSFCLKIISGNRFITPLFPWYASLGCCCPVAKSCLTFCDPMDCSTPGFPVLHYLSEFAQTHVHWVSDAIQPSCPLLSPSPPAFNLAQHQGLLQWTSSSHQVAKVLELQLQHQSFQWIFRVDFL